MVHIFGITILRTSQFDNIVEGAQRRIAEIQRVATANSDLIFKLRKQCKKLKNDLREREIELCRIQKNSAK